MSTDSSSDSPSSTSGPSDVGPPDGQSDPRPDPRAEPPSRYRRAVNWLRDHSKHVLVVAVLSAAVGAAVPPLADQAVSNLVDDAPPKCPGAGCDGKNPIKEGCAADAVTWEPQTDNPVALRVRYSKHCGAVWGQLLAGEKGDTVTVRAGGSQQTALVQYGRDQFTPMGAVGKTCRARVCAVPTQVDSRTGTWERYCITATEETNWKR